MFLLVIKKFKKVRKIFFTDFTDTRPLDVMIHCLNYLLGTTGGISASFTGRLAPGAIGGRAFVKSKSLKVVNNKSGHISL